MARSARWLIATLTVVVVGALGEFHAHEVGHYPFTQLPRFAWLCAFIVLIWVSTYAAGIPDEVLSGGEALVRATAALCASAGIVSLFALLAGTPLLPRFVVLTSVALVAPLDASVSLLVRKSRRRASEAERVLAIVDDAEARLLEAELGRNPERRAVLVSSSNAAFMHADRDARYLEELVAHERATLLVLDRAAQADDKLVAEVAALHRAGIRVRTLSLFYDEWLGKLPVAELERISLLFDIHELHRPSYPPVKRVLDVAISIPGVILFALVTPFVALANIVANPGPLLYRQLRVGKDGNEFTILKFRTMAPGGDVRWTAKSDPRLGRLGRVMRRSHVDELPQFVNVLRRDLSVVGPRPEQPRYVESLREKIPYYDVRHLVRPGMTGWAQVKYGYGGSESDALEKLQYEFFYLRHQSLLLDLRIVGRTLRSIVGRRGR
jgi:lipopolysaccharide/colanic/teichoic acid biosynthesis glycosyltransferase